MKTYYTNDIKNPYCSNGKFLWKHNDDKTLGGDLDELKKFGRKMKRGVNKLNKMHERHFNEQYGTDTMKERFKAMQ